MVMEEVTAKVSHRVDVETTGGGGGGGAGLALGGVNNNNVNSASTGGDGTLGGEGVGGPNNNINNNAGSQSTVGTSNFYVIGLEFVRQYYTVLHQGPLYLHRFYSEDSSFVHDDSRVVYGQGDIRERIQQLNFRNCVAKILQVDSHETLGDGVVIQVRGELSNNGQPMRRFMQTFVLAPQSPKRFYVRNDIFHYQDEAIPKDDMKASSPVDSTLTQEDAEEKSDEEIDLTEDISLPNTVHSNEEVESERRSDLLLAVAETIKQEPMVSPPVAEVSILDSKSDEGLKIENDGGPRKTSHGFLVTSGEADSAGRGGQPPPKQEQEPQQAPVNAVPTPKTFANLFKNDLPPTQSSFPAQINRNPFPTPPVIKKEQNTSPGSNETGGSDGSSMRSPPNASPQPPNYEGGRGLPPRGGGYGMGYRGTTYRGQDRDRRENRERLTSRSSTVNDDTGSIDGDRRPINTYPDTHQLFVGNLPHTVTADEIKGIFQTYGKVADVKILRPNQKKAGTTVPYFSFVVFEEASAAQNAIHEKSKITMKMADGTNRRLNVEEKHARGDGSERSFSTGGGSNAGGYVPYVPRGDSSNNIPGERQGGGCGGSGGGGSNKPYGPRSGGSSGRGGNAGGDAGNSSSNNERGIGRGGGGQGQGQGGQGSGGGGSEQHRSGDRGHPRTHSRTFRGSNRGGGVGERGGGQTSGGGGGPGAR